MQEKIEEWKKMLQARLDARRYHHSLCVMEEAERLARQYGADVEKARIAGLLHDMTKNDTEEQHFDVFTRGGIELDEVARSTKKLHHAISGAWRIEHELGVTDREILDAVRYHTTARAGMTLLDKVLYLADFVSADRDYEGVEALRALVHQDLEAGLREALSFSIAELLQKPAPIHRDTVEAWNAEMLQRKETTI